MNYAAGEMYHQLHRGPGNSEGFYRLKVTGNGETRWVNISTDQLKAIVNLLNDSPKVHQK